MNKQTLNIKEQWLSYSGAFLFFLIIIGLANYFSDAEIILPEVAAMAVGLFAFREQSWMKQPEKIFILPSMTAIMGFGINCLEIAFLLKLGIVLIIMLLLIFLLKYSLAPALATGFLPIVTHAHSFSFIVSILISTFLLMLIVYLFKLNKGSNRKSSIDKSAMLFYFGIMFCWMLITYLFGYEGFAVIPPIAVVVYESLHMKMYTVKMAFKTTVLLFLSAWIGVFLFLNIENWLLVGTLDFACMFLLLKLFKMHIPAVYAFPFLAFILPKHIIGGLPLAGLCMSIFALGFILLSRTYRMRMQLKTKVS